MLVLYCIYMYTCIKHSHEYMALAKNTSVLREAVLLFVDPKHGRNISVQYIHWPQ